MKSSRPLIIVVGLSVMALVVLNISLKSFNTKTVSVGCSPLSVSGEFDPTSTVAFWQNQTVFPPRAMADTLSASQKTVLSAKIPNDKWLEVDLKKQVLTAHDGDTIFIETPISSGLYDSTPPGEYHIWYKIRSTLMEGGSKLNRTYYYLPNVPYAMFFYGDYGIHGTYWHNNFGTPMSHGCVNTPTVIAEKLFYWTDPQLPDKKNMVRASEDNPGTRVVIHK